MKKIPVPSLPLLIYSFMESPSFQHPLPILPLDANANDTKNLWKEAGSQTDKIWNSVEPL